MLLRICLILAILGGGGVIAVNFLMVQKAVVVVVADRDDQKTHREEAEKERDSTKKTLKETQAKLDTTTKNLAQTRTQLDTANGKVEDLGKKNEDLTTKLHDTQGHLEEKQSELAKWEQLHLTPVEVVQIQDDLKKNKTALAGVIEEKKLLFTQLQDKTRELAAILGTNENAQEPPGLKGKIVAVDPKYEFVVLNIGDDKSVVVNGVMMVARDGKLIGKVKIARVDKTQSVANVIPAWRLGEVMEGDEVLY